MRLADQEAAANRHGEQAVGDQEDDDGDGADELAPAVGHGRMHARAGAAVSSLPGRGVPAKWRGMTISPTERQIAARLPIKLWLYGVATLLILMVLIGGATRLTDCGLSITEWQPCLGAIPPLNEADWLAAFEKYKHIPEYRSKAGHGAV